MAQIDFIDQLKALGYYPQEPKSGWIEILYIVQIGKNTGKTLNLAFQVSDDFPMNCPPGPHFKSLGIAGWVEPPNNIHASPLGAEWRYWSRPFHDWNRTHRNAKVYLAHIKNLLMNL